jgi:hypothetical protein
MRPVNPNHHTPLRADWGSTSDPLHTAKRGNRGTITLACGEFRLAQPQLMLLTIVLNAHVTLLCNSRLNLEKELCESRFSLYHLPLFQIRKEILCENRFHSIIYPDLRPILVKIKATD